MGEIISTTKNCLEFYERGWEGWGEGNGCFPKVGTRLAEEPGSGGFAQNTTSTINTPLDVVVHFSTPSPPKCFTIFLTFIEMYFFLIAIICAFKSGPQLSINTVKQNNVKLMDDTTYLHLFSNTHLY